MDKPTLALLLAAFAPAAFAASSADLNVFGTITPSACAPVLSDGGVIDHGKMTSKDLQPAAPTRLAPAEIRLEVLCEGETFFTLTTVDNRAGTSAINPRHHGLGLTPEKEKLGSVAFSLFDPVADDNPVKVITSSNGGANWSESIYLGHEALTSFAALDGPNTPIALKTLNARLRTFAIIVPATDLTLLDEVPIDGQATLQLKYW
ncbi:DUF1120 domain-containing protein [Pseudomonas sp. WS 5106]|uniref:DUF1120 domain-containing protein n=1 Tax=Pseudomonas cremoris TaxID=2724178 RepID=A0A7X1AKP5_9PSED|nr:DUF1120 domain-containing protein [Pseudomonas cremoris]MBC2381886.1 DUF1120 domain-containing protein [Pseudomonas cremoris]MBC2405703.1 DUF1120 domain-containing protein [Pseudomonas cremoris]MBC2406339.1 DUF1120 domain-containing protein [Pseudomonas cremoris]